MDKKNGKTDLVIFEALTFVTVVLILSVSMHLIIGSATGEWNKPPGFINGSNTKKYKRSITQYNPSRLK